MEDRDVYDLFRAVRNGKVRQVAVLLEEGMNPNTRDDNQQTPLMQAVHIRKDDVRTHVVRLLLNQGSDVNAQDDEGRTVLMVAAHEPQREDVARRLVATGECNPNLVDRKGDTCLMYAVYGGNAGIIRILVNSSQTKMIIDVDKKNDDGINPLLLAYRLRQAECCKVLLEEGHADMNAVRDRAGLLDMLQKEYGGWNSPLKELKNFGQDSSVPSISLPMPVSWHQVRKIDNVPELSDDHIIHKVKKFKKKRKLDRLNVSMSDSESQLNPLAISPTASRNILEKDIYPSSPRNSRAGNRSLQSWRLSPISHVSIGKATPVKCMPMYGERIGTAHTLRSLRFTSSSPETTYSTYGLLGRLTPLETVPGMSEDMEGMLSKGGDNHNVLPSIMTRNGRVNLISSPEVQQRHWLMLMSVKDWKKQGVNNGAASAVPPFPNRLASTHFVCKIQHIL